MDETDVTIQEPEMDAVDATAAIETADDADDSAPFPRARVVRLIKEESNGKIIRSEVKEAMNNWLGDITKKVAKDMGNTQYTSVGIADFQRATKPYDMIEDIVKDRERIIMTAEKLKIDADHLIREMNRFFEVLKTGKEKEE
ncbi:MAG: hypothetical protein J4451_01610 [DPANN group archaeon]|nr:hypothetical protein [DPANN group archaeon]